MNAHPSSLSDRDLLELAAKAAGYRVDSVTTRCMVNDGIALFDTGGVWNPLEDDGDALRLAVKVGLTIETAANGSCADAAAYLPGHPDVADVEWVGMDPSNAHQAIRRAIVRAAAAIGQAK